MHYVTLRPLRRAKRRGRVIFSDLVCSRMRGIFSGVAPDGGMEYVCGLMGRARGSGAAPRRSGDEAGDTPERET